MREHSCCKFSNQYGSECFSTLWKIMREKAFISGGDLTQIWVKIVFDSSYKQPVWFESKDQVIWIKSQDYMSDPLCDLSHIFFDLNHTIRVMRTCDLNQDCRIKTIGSSILFD